jgi:hypothetical protein
MKLFGFSRILTQSDAEVSRTFVGIHFRYFIRAPAENTLGKRITSE